MQKKNPKRKGKKKQPRVKILKADPKNNILAKPGGIAVFIDTSYSYVLPKGLVAHIKFFYQLPFAYARYKKIYEEGK